MSAGLCGCGCGQPTPIALKNRADRGHIKGQPTPFIQSHRRRRPGTYKNTIFHDRPTGEVLVQVHIVIAERALGHRLPSGAETHHVDGNKQNNANANLVICQDHGYHMLLHMRRRVLKAGGDPNTHKMCARCGHAKLFHEFTRSNTKGSVYGLDCLCRECKRDKFTTWYAARHADPSRHRQEHRIGVVDPPGAGEATDDAARLRLRERVQGL